MAFAPGHDWIVSVVYVGGEEEDDDDDNGDLGAFNNDLDADNDNVEVTDVDTIAIDSYNKHIVEALYIVNDGIILIMILLLII